MHHSNTRRFHKHLKSPEGKEDKCLPTAKTGGQEEFVVVDQISGAKGGGLVIIIEVKRWPNQILRLHKTLYGLKQATRVWYQTLDPLLQTLGFIRVRVDYGVWVRHNSDTDHTRSWILVYVDGYSCHWQTFHS